MTARSAGVGATARPSRRRQHLDMEPADWFWLGFGALSALAGIVMMAGTAAGWWSM